MQKLCVRHFFTCSFEILCKGTYFFSKLQYLQIGILGFENCRNEDKQI